MPLQTSLSPPTTLAKTLSETAAQNPSKPVYLIAYASLTGGRSWCGDCRDAEAFVDAKFAGREDVVWVLYVGGREEWRRSDNPWKQGPFEVVKLPTVVKVTGDKWERLVEGDVYDQSKLDDFVTG